MLDFRWKWLRVRAFENALTTTLVYTLFRKQKRVCWALSVAFTTFSIYDGHNLNVFSTYVLHKSHFGIFARMSPLVLYVCVFGVVFIYTYDYAYITILPADSTYNMKIMLRFSTFSLDTGQTQPLMMKTSLSCNNRYCNILAWRFRFFFVHLCDIALYSLVDVIYCFLIRKSFNCGICSGESTTPMLQFWFFGFCIVDCGD